MAIFDKILSIGEGKTLRRGTLKTVCALKPQMLAEQPSSGLRGGSELEHIQGRAEADKDLVEMDFPVCARTWPAWPM